MHNLLFTMYLPNEQSICISQTAVIISHLKSSSLLDDEKRINKNFRYDGGFDCLRVILIIAFV